MNDNEKPRIILPEGVRRPEPPPSIDRQLEPGWKMRDQEKADQALKEFEETLSETTGYDKTKPISEAERKRRSWRKGIKGFFIGFLVWIVFWFVVGMISPELQQFALSDSTLDLLRSDEEIGPISLWLMEISVNPLSFALVIATWSWVRARYLTKYEKHNPKWWD